MSRSNNMSADFQSCLLNLAHAHASEIEELRRQVQEFHVQLNPPMAPSMKPKTPKGASNFHCVRGPPLTPPAEPQMQDEPAWSSLIQGTEACVTITKSPDQDPGQSSDKVRKVSLDDAVVCVGSDVASIEDLASPPSHGSQPSWSVASSSNLNLRKSSTSDADAEKMYQAQRLSEKISEQRATALRQMSSEAIHKHIRSLVTSLQFEVFFAFVIITNSVFLGIRVEVCADCPDDGDSMILRTIEYVYATLFACELCLRVIAGGLNVFCKKSCLWYWLDVFVVGASLVEVVLDFSEDKGGNGTSMTHLRMFRVMRIVRLLKIVRIARVVRFVRALRVLVLSILHTLRSVMWAFVLLFMIIYVFGLVLVQVVRDRIHQSTSAHADSALAEYWGTLPRSMFTLYKCVTNGISWHEVVTPLAEVNGITVAIFILYISFTVFAVLNVITGVFCEAAIESARQDHEMMIQQHLAQKSEFVKSISSLFGVDHEHGEVMLTYGEFEAVLMDDKCKTQLAVMELDSADAWELFKLLDSDESNLIDVQEFISGCLRLKGLAKAIDVAKLAYESKLRQKKVLKYFDLVDRKLNKVMHHLLVLEGKGHKTTYSRSTTRQSSSLWQTGTPGQQCSGGSLLDG